VVGSCKHGKRISGFSKSRKFLNWLRYSALHGRPCTRKSAMFFSSISSTFIGQNHFLHHLTLTVDTGELHSSRISQSIKSQRGEDLIYITVEARNHTPYTHSVLNKALARNQLSVLLVLIQSDLH
jgi:hypothetical protein